MGGSIKLDLDLIGNLASDLSRLHSDFDHVAATADDYETGVGSSTITSAIAEFGSNWDIRRGRLMESIKAVAEMAESAHEGFTQTEMDLANKILGKDS
ncbi:hypothetical protein N8D74_04980 [Curtobacterium flaccumfaciens]|uniref:WXG100 family type VII secretion target n=1 Tax=Curtobacterium poinsettiae TaxID=159612 RepID=A0A9Q9T3F4_9MICO|nr:hypothetical protein [Curtobacterium flaccumfaciens]UXN26239.1 hypothetical protein N8D74_04980 [Curtobacterium flaccumfaciens]UYC81083.1 hypothetical protein OE229_01070 [Curtobacterium flaccumfaciens pv. poinsettiae]